MQYIQCGDVEGLPMFPSCHWREREVGVFSIAQAQELYSLLVRLAHHFSPQHPSVSLIRHFDHPLFTFPLDKHIPAVEEVGFFSLNAWYKCLNVFQTMCLAST